jgi:ribosomal protein L13E
MICEFLPIEYKRRLLKIATTEELMEAGFTQGSAYNARRLGIISDERCDRLVNILGKRALPIIKEALREFEEHVRELEAELGTPEEAIAKQG